MYATFTKEKAGDVKFMRMWLHLFVHMHKGNFMKLEKAYFKSKGLAIDKWMDGIIKGRKGDVLVLMGLYLLIEKHAHVHLKDGKFWTSLKTVPNNHDELMDHCNLHLAYLGRGIFLTLTERDKPLQVIPTSDDVKPVIIGELTNKEEEMVDHLLKAGLGVAIYRPIVPQKQATASTVTKPEPKDHGEPKASTSDKVATEMAQLVTQSSVSENIPASSSSHPDSLPPSTKGDSAPFTSQEVTVPVASTLGVSSIPSDKEDTMNIADVANKTTVVLELKKLKIQPGEVVVCNDELLNCMPDSKYGAQPAYDACLEPQSKDYDPTDRHNMSAETVSYYDTDEMQSYWPHSDNDAATALMMYQQVITVITQQKIGGLNININ